MFKVENIKYVRNNLQIFQIKFWILGIMKQAAILNVGISSNYFKFFLFVVFVFLMAESDEI